MKFEKIHNKGQARLFQYPFLEMLTKANPLVIWGMYLPFIIGLPIYAASSLGFGAGKVALLFLGGMLFWTLFEYLAHRFAFHWIAESERAQKFVYIMHGNHHHFPRDRERLFMPPLPSIILASAILGSSTWFYAIIPSHSSRGLYLDTSCMHPCTMPFMPGILPSSG